MALFRLQGFLEHPFIAGRSFSHTFIVAATDIVVAAGAQPSVSEFLREVYDENFLHTYVRISTLTPGDDVFTTVAVNDPGVRGFSGETLPLFNTVRLDVNASTGRPSRWHIRGLHEGEVGNNQVGSTLRTLIEDAYAALVTALGENEFNLFQPDGNELAATGICAIDVKLRKLHRKRRKPVI
jgi:hypothetical protein